MTEAPPKLLFRFRSFDGEFGRSAIEDAIANSRMYWSSPSAFNDPFDCNPVFYLGDIDKQILAFSKKMALASPFGSRKEKLIRARNTLKFSKQFMEGFERHWRSYIEESAVACFSSSPESSLMWGHYASSHSGICLVFDFSIISDFTGPYAVDYVDKRSRINLSTSNPDNFMKLAILKKHEHWKYEQEWRFVNWRGGKGFRNYPANALVGVVMGSRIKLDDELFLLDLLKSRADIRVYRAYMDEIEFKMNIKQI